MCSVRSRNRKNMITELMLKIWLYNRFVLEMASAGYWEVLCQEELCDRATRADVESGGVLPCVVH